MIELARADAVDLVVKGLFGGVERGWVYRSATADFKSDEATAFHVDRAELVALASPVSKLTFTVVPKGSGVRLGIDRDRDGVFDFDEL